MLNILEENMINDMGSALARNTLEDIPEPRPDAKHITGLVKKNGRISGYQLSDGSILDKEQGVTMAKNGGIHGVGIGKRNGNEYLKALPDHMEGNNLGNLPSISQ